MTLTVLVAVVGLTPLAAVVLMSSFERSRRGPFVPDSEGNLPHGGLLKLARFFEVLGTAAFVSAVAFGSYALVLGIGPSADGAPGFATLPAGLLELTSTAVTSEATHTYYTHLVGGVLVGITASLAARLLAEISARLALLKRG